MPAFPAAIPATCVPWSEFGPSNASRAACVFAVGGAKARATMTFAFVKRRCPFGKPAGIVYPAGLKNGCDWSTPLSMKPIFTPWPAVERPAPQSTFAPICCGVESSCTP